MFPTLYPTNLTIIFTKIEELATRAALEGSRGLEKQYENTNIKAQVGLLGQENPAQNMEFFCSFNTIHKASRQRSLQHLVHVKCMKRPGWPSGGQNEIHNNIHLQLIPPANKVSPITTNRRSANDNIWIACIIWHSGGSGRVEHSHGVWKSFAGTCLRFQTNKSCAWFVVE